MKIINKLLAVFIISVICYSCGDYLDVVPDNTATLDNAFTNRNEAEKYLFTCYSYLPDFAHANTNTSMMAADEMWTIKSIGDAYYKPWRIARGQQNRNEPYMNNWEGRENGVNFYNAIHDCNIFLRNVGDMNKVTDLNISMRYRWLSEVKFLKAYYHFLLFRMYGPVVIMDEDIPVDTPKENIKLKRAPVDEVVQYISDILDEAYTDLPQDIANKSEELGRITKPAAKALKARLLVTAASPLFNGNPDYANFTDKEGIHLFNSEYSEEKWTKAVEACKEAIDACHANYMKLYTFSSTTPLSDTTMIQMSIRNSFTERWNSEIIWAFSGRRATELQTDCMGRIDPRFLSNMWVAKEYISPTIEAASKYYTHNGVPIDEDKEWDYSGRYEIKDITDEYRFNLAKNYKTIKFNFDRENRYYAYVAFDGAVWYMQNSPSGSDEDTYTVKGRAGQPQGKAGANNYSVTGYWTKKLVNWKYVMSDNGVTREEYPWPELRLSELYLLYAEALNEADQRDEAIVWIDKIRERAGLKGVEESWTKYSIKPTKFRTKEGLREIIQRERTIELMFEGHRFWDLRRWKTAPNELNKIIQGWDIEQEIPEAYYRPRHLYTMKFVAPRDYLWPLREHTLLINTDLVQNPGW